MKIKIKIILPNRNSGSLKSTDKISYCGHYYSFWRDLVEFCQFEQGYDLKNAIGKDIAEPRFIRVLQNQNYISKNMQNQNQNHFENQNQNQNHFEIWRQNQNQNHL